MLSQKTLKVLSAGHHHIWQYYLASQGSSQQRKPLGSLHRSVLLAVLRVSRVGYGIVWVGLLLLACLSGCSPQTVIPSAVGTASPLSATLTPIPASPMPTPTRPQATLSPQTVTATEAAALTSTPTETALPCWQDGGQVESGALETDLLRQPLEFRVYLPPCYAQQPERAYPVLYLIHGQGSTDDQWERLGAGDITSALVASGELPPFLIVMPRDRIWLEPGEDPFGQAFMEVLLPHIDASYRTMAEREFRAVGGLSRGGAWALHLGLNFPDAFGAVGMHSGFAFHSDIPYIKLWLEAIPAELMPRFWLDIGDNDRPEIAASAIWFEGLLTQYRIPHEWHTYAGYHEESYWQAHVEQYLRWYAQDWLVEP